MKVNLVVVRHEGGNLLVTMYFQPAKCHLGSQVRPLQYRLLWQVRQVIARLWKKLFCRGWNGLNLTWETLEGVIKHNGPLKGEPHIAARELQEKMDMRFDTYASMEAHAAAIDRIREALGRLRPVLVSLKVADITGKASAASIASAVGLVMVTVGPWPSTVKVHELSTKLPALSAICSLTV